MINELLFIAQNIVIAACSLACLYLGSGALTAFIGVCWILGNFFVLKQVTLFGMPVVTSDVYIVGANLAVALLRHYYGQKNTERALWSASFCSAFFMLMSVFLLAYQPNAFDVTNPAYTLLLTPIPRLVIASFSVALASAYLHVWLYNFFSSIWHTQSFYTINMFALLISQLADTILFGILGMYGLVHAILPIMIMSYAIKVLSIFICTPFISISYPLHRKD